ncbi:MAG: helix-turn-helix transcriptional regulator [Alphaproteobacteria bacterium]|jgi:phage repressor protein C with HTH and peptisase S24 domain
MTRLHDKIRRIIETTPRLTQRGLAERMGLDPAAVNRMLYGRRGIMAEEIPVIEAYLGQRLDLTEVAAGARRGLSDVPQADVAPPQAHSTPPALPDTMAPVPVRDALSGDDTPIDWTPRHPAQAGIRAAFALYVTDDRMSPRYFPGETVYVHPHRPPAPPQDIVIAGASGALSICRLIRSDGDFLTVQYLNPAREEKISRSSITAIYAIVGRS